MARGKVPQPQGKDVLKHYFGFSDAADEDDLDRLFVATSEFDGLKYGRRAKGSFVVTGSKGSGKTAICRYLGSNFRYQPDLEGRQPKSICQCAC